MTPKDYIKTQVILVELGLTIDRLDLEGTLEALDQVREKLAASPDSPMKEKAARNAELTRSLVHAFQFVQKTFREVKGEVTSANVGTLVKVPDVKIPSHS